MIHLFTPLLIRDIPLKNRIVVSPMCQYSSNDGFANDWHFVHLGSRAVGGAGLVFTEATAVLPEGRITPDDLGIWKDEHIGELRRIVQFVHAQGSEAGIQLAHAGRKASMTSPWKGNRLLLEEEGGWQTWAPSKVPFSEQVAMPEELTPEQIRRVIRGFVAAAERAWAAGFRVIEIHAAHGYLLNEFLSPLSNRRTDGYGGNFANRTRLLLEVVDGIRAVVPSGHALFVRISATDYVEGGWQMPDSLALAALLKEHGVDLIDCSSGGLMAKASIPVGPAYQVPFAQGIREATGILTGAVGLITDAVQA
ncbi:MAG: NADH:flavin oxidoreductase/NADH oxidase, partial [Bacteroidota bacterium]|nr:NADH:flavin oxidoreductase/NADH oxidase [Bacteroidota bacterium]